MCFIFGQQKVIVLDPGHGGTDSGAIGINNVLEKDVVLNVAKEIVVLNNTLFDDKFDIYSTRYTDTLTSLNDRGRLARALNADVFVSLHCNHSDNPNARGVEIYVSNWNTNYFEKAVWLAFNLQKDLNEKLGFETRGVKFANFQVIRETSDFMPSVLLELGFLSNGDESNYFQNPDSYCFLALAILECLIKNLDCYERIGG
ncbi:N-acetylmuramoyl-L-alanine amidase family protein [Flagellimonas aurea]|nr:N-acetylmuramoyl-L-alanine amidase [Allomuricauda aurea]